MNSFAKTQLLKYGWTEGKGLGKNEDGIVDALRPKLKFDNSGIGHDESSDQWWSSVYDRASKNVKIEKIEESNKMFKIGDETDGIELSGVKSRLKKIKKTHDLRYGSFLKTSILENGKIRDENLSKNLDEMIKETASVALTDDELFRACGGRTAHKGARHGLKLSGKLARIAQQEAEILGKMDEIENNEKWTKVESKRKKSKCKRRRETEIGNLIENSGTIEDPTRLDANANDVASISSNFINNDFPIDENSLEIRKKSKTARRKEKRCFQALVTKLNAFSLIDDKTNDDDDNDDGASVVKKRKKTKLTNEINDTKDKILKKKIKRNKKTRTNENIKPEVTKNLKIFTTAEKLNHRIKKIKKKAQGRNEKKSLKRLSDCLMAVNLSEDSVDSGRGDDLTFNTELSKKLKKLKKSRKNKRDKKIFNKFDLDK